MNKPIKKVFVLDTNVILHDPDCIHKFQEHDVVIATIVLEELDKFKKGNEERNHNARQFIRSMDVFRKEKHEKKSALSNGGVSLGTGKGLIQVKITGKISEEIKIAFPEDMSDNRILGLVFDMSNKKDETRKVIFVTKDVNLRIKADVLGLEAEDYENDKTKFEGLLGRAKCPNYPQEKIKKFYSKPQEPQEADKILAKCVTGGIPENMYFILGEAKTEAKESEKSPTALARYSEGKLSILQKKEKISGIMPRNAEQTFSVNALLDLYIKLICLSGKAGTGKTLFSIAAGLQLLKEEKVAQLIIAAATVPLGNKEIGFLPGDAQEKVSPYMQGLFDNLAFIKRQMNQKDGDFIDQKQKAGLISIQPLASIRGRSLNDTFFVIDESQNLTPHEVKTIVTRAGHNTKIVFCGDVSQIDSPYLDAYSNGLSHLITKMTGQKIFAHVMLEKGERSELAELAANIL